MTAALTLNVTFAPEGDYLHAVVRGLASFESARAVLVRVGEEAARLDCPGVLIDCLGILGQTAAYDHAQLGAVLADQLAGRRCALVTAANKIQGVMGGTARERGLDYRAFADLAEAGAWLRS